MTRNNRSHVSNSNNKALNTRVRRTSQRRFGVENLLNNDSVTYRPGAYTFVSTEEEEPTRLDTVAAIEPSQPETPQHGVQHNTIVDPPPIEALTAPQIQWPISVHPTRGAFEIPDSEFPSTPRRQRRNGLPVTALILFRTWLRRNFLHPYLTAEERVFFQQHTNLQKRQINDWFTNARRRYLLQLVVLADRIWGERVINRYLDVDERVRIKINKHRNRR
ncbi:MAG: hypothetical protein EXX96DRAFT_548485 [Benjaminiella poitrasii]|nr:MAG: hypothetical protein EXX96DRAFT_548485 [Benjaminiella poitrasii]